MWFLWFMNFSSRTIFSPILPLIEDTFAVTHARASSIFIFISIGYGFAVFLAGVFARLLGARKCITVSLLIMAGAFGLISFIPVFEIFYVVGFFLGVAGGMYLPSMIPLLTEYYDQKIWGKVISIHDTGATICIFGIPFIALILLRFVSWRGIFFVFALVLLVCAVVFYSIIEESRIVQERKNFLWGLWIRKTILLMTPAHVFIGGASMGLYYITPLYLVKELGMPGEYANAIFGISRIGGVIVGMSAGFLVDRISPKKTLFTLVLISGILTMLVAVAEVAWIKLSLFLQASVVVGFFPVMFVAIARLFDPETRGPATGCILMAGVVLGMGLIPYLLGLSGDLASFRFGILVLGVLTALSSVPLLFLRELD
jgi:MFS family permease